MNTKIQGIHVHKASMDSLDLQLQHNEFLYPTTKKSNNQKKNKDKANRNL